MVTQTSNTGSQYLSHQVASVLQRSSLGVVMVLCQVFDYRNALSSTKRKTLHCAVRNFIVRDEDNKCNETRHDGKLNITTLLF